MLLSSIVIIGLEIAQLLHQGSINGIFYWLGERHFTSSTPGLAKITLLGMELVRPYSIFSHPNSLAGYLFILLLLNLKNQKYRLFNPLLILGIILTFSKAAIMAMLLLFLNLPLVLLLVGLIFVNIFPILPFVYNNLPLSISSRFQFYKSSISLFINYPYFGVGYGNYLKGLLDVIPQRYFSFLVIQPVHNFFLLFLVEYGLANSLFILYCLRRYLVKIFTSHYLKQILILLLLMSLDHYFYTLPQNKIILFIALVYLV